MVVQTPENQRAVRDLLDQLRTTIPTTPATRPEEGSSRWVPQMDRWVPMDSRGAETRLRRKVGEFRTINMPLKTAIERAGAFADLDVLIDPAALEAIATTPPLTVWMRDISAANVLELVLKTGAPPRAGRRLDWALDGELLVIYSPDQYRGKRITMRRYDLREWFRVAEMAEAAGMFRHKGKPSPSLSAHDRLAAWAGTALVDEVARGTWNDGYGQGGTVRELGGFLFVTQTYYNHELVRRFLDSMRQDALAIEPRLRDSGAPGATNPAPSRGDR
jgi:hypothetical protein